MGGSIKVIHVIGERVDIQTRWTNSLPEYVKSPGFVRSDPKWIQDYLTRESQYREDKETFSPNGYGLDIFDFNKKKIYSNQGYCGYDRIDYANIDIWLHNQVADIETSAGGGLTIIPVTEKDDTFYPRFVKEMWDEDMLLVTCLKDPKQYFSPANIINYSKEDLDGRSFEQVYELLKKFEGARFSGERPTNLKYNGYCFTVNWNKFGWELKTYSEDTEGWKQYLEDITKEYVLTSEDLKDWSQYIEEHDE